MSQIYAKKRWEREGIRGGPGGACCRHGTGVRNGGRAAVRDWGGLRKDFLQKSIDSFRMAHDQDMAGFWNDMRRMGEANG